MSCTIKVKKLDERAEMPKNYHETDTGYDLKFIDIHKISGDVIFFRTGLSVEPPKGYYFDIVPRSSISKTPLSMANSVGIIDWSYRGELIIPVRVHHTKMGMENKNEMFAGGIAEIFGKRPQSLASLARLILHEKPHMFQLVLRKKYKCNFVDVDDLSETERDSGGFGSTDLPNIDEAFEKNSKPTK